MDAKRELRLKRNEKIFQEISESIRKCNIRIIFQREKRGRKEQKEIIAENFPNLWKELELHVNEANSTPNYISVNGPPRHILVKLAKVNDKEKILRATRQEKITYKGSPIRLSVDFSAETVQAKREWNDVFKILKEKCLQPRVLYPRKISLRYAGEIKTFSDKQRWMEFIATDPFYKKIKKFLILEEKGFSKP